MSTVNDDYDDERQDEVDGADAQVRRDHLPIPTDRDRGLSLVGDLDADDIDREPSSTLALFEGDRGGLPLAQRKALVVLLKQRFISAQTHPKEWRALMEAPEAIRSRLNDLFMDLHLDREREVAYKHQVAPEAGGRPFPTLLYDTPWGREDTILLVYLRQRARQEQATGADRVFVDRTDMLDAIDSHRPAHTTDRTGYSRRAANAVEAVYKAGLLIGPSTGDRFEVSNAIEVLLPVPRLRELLDWLRTQNDPAAPPPPDQTAEHIADLDDQTDQSEDLS